MQPLRVFVCEEQPVVVEGLLRVFQDSGHLTFAGTAPSVAGTISELSRQSVDVLLIGQPPTARTVLPLLASLGETPRVVPTILWVSDIGEVDTLRALRMGARGIIRRTDGISVVLQALRAVGSGGTWLVESIAANPAPRSASARITTRERQVIAYVCQGLPNREIGKAMGIAPGTVKVHLMHIFEKTGLRDRFALAEHGRKFLHNAAPE